MQGRTFDPRWALLLSTIVLAAVLIAMAGRNEREAPASAQAVAPPARISQALGARAVRAPTAPTLAESLIAVDLLVKADKLPTLAESLIAADLLVKAGVISPPTPPLIEILRAASLLSAARTPPVAQDQPPSLAADTPQPAPPTRTPVPAKKTPVTAAAGSSGGYVDDGFTAQLFSQVNQRRLAAGLQPLAIEPRLADAAATYARVLADSNWFSHTGPDGSTLVTRAEAAGFPFTVQIGEVLAWGSNGWTAAEIVQAWIDSPAHRDQILNPAYTRGGAGCYFTSTSHTTVRCAMELAAG